MHRHAHRDRLDGRHELRRVLQPVGLRQHDLRHRAALPDRDEVALDAARLELGPERRHDERDVDVRRKRLLLRCLAGGLTDECAPPWQNRTDEPVAQRHPIADGDVDALVQQPSGQPRSNGAVGRCNVVCGTVRRYDTPGHEAGLQLFGELGSPPERAQIELRQRRISFGM